MRITRYINGKRISKPFDSNIVVENAEISQAIYKANRRFIGAEETHQLNNHGGENE